MRYSEFRQLTSAPAFPFFVTLPKVCIPRGTKVGTKLHVHLGPADDRLILEGCVTAFLPSGAARIEFLRKMPKGSKSQRSIRFGVKEKAQIEAEVREIMSYFGL